MITRYFSQRTPVLPVSLPHRQLCCYFVARRGFTAMEAGMSPTPQQQPTEQTVRPPAAAPHSALQTIALSELHKELERDEGSSGNAPLPPRGWSVVHTPGSSTFTMTSTPTFKAAGRSSTSGGSSSNRLKPFLGTSAASQSLSNSKRRWSAKVDVYARFESMDPSFWDPSISLCEVVPFRVMIERIVPPPPQQEHSFSSPSFVSATFSSSSSSSSSASHKRYHSTMLVADCASVQSRLRLRRVFFAPCSDRTALLEEASTGCPHGVFVGPNVASLSQELKTATMEWLSGCGVDDRLAEFICQMGYYFEHEEYELWLARLANFAGKSGPPAKRGPSSSPDATGGIWGNDDGDGDDDDDDGPSSSRAAFSLQEAAKDVARRDVSRGDISLSPTAARKMANILSRAESSVGGSGSEDVTAMSAAVSGNLKERTRLDRKRK